MELGPGEGRENDSRRMKPELLSRIDHWTFYGSRSGDWGRSGAVFGAQKLHQLDDFILSERVLEAGHFLSAVFDLVDDLRGLQSFAHGGQRGASGGSLCGHTMAVGAALIAKEHGAGEFRGFGTCGKRGSAGDDDEEGDSKARDESRELLSGWIHTFIFSLIPG